MAPSPTVVTHFKDLAVDDEVRDAIEKHCARLAQEFQEVMRFEFTLVENGSGFAANGHVTGKNRDLSAQADGPALRSAAERALDKIERQLRKIHDKRIFSQRREAQKAPPKRKNPE
jgi:ribosomal subunit interface protein